MQKGGGEVGRTRFIASPWTDGKRHGDFLRAALRVSSVSLLIFRDGRRDPELISRSSRICIFRETPGNSFVHREEIKNG